MPKLNALHARLFAQQRALLLQAAEHDVLPSAGALNQIGGLEGALGALDAMMDGKGRAPSKVLTIPVPVPAPPPEPAFRGWVKWFNVSKAIGFIVPDDGGEDVVVYLTALERSGLTSLREGQRVAYQLETDPGTQWTCAVAIELLD